MFLSTFQLYDYVKLLFKPMQKKYSDVLPRLHVDSMELCASRFFVDFNIVYSCKRLFIIGYYRSREYIGSTMDMYRLSVDNTDEIYNWLSADKLEELLKLTIKYTNFYGKWENFITDYRISESRGIPFHGKIPYEYTVGLKNLETETELLYL